MRARNIKPGFYKNAKLVECSRDARLIAPGLWMLADREGRLLDRHRQIKMELLPADSIDIDPLLQELHIHGHILRYEIDGKRYIQILGFDDHQSPHHLEKSSIIPPPIENYSENNPSMSRDIPRQDRDKTETRPGPISPDSLIPDSLNPDSLNPECSSDEEYKNTRAQEISNFIDRQRLTGDLPEYWLSDCKQETGWEEPIIRDIWTKFSGHWKRKIGQAALKTEEEWGAEWRLWFRGSNIKLQGNTDGKQIKSQIQRAVEATERARIAREQRSAGQTG